MNEEIVIRAEGLGKQYRIGTAQAPYGTFRDAVTDLARRQVRRWRGDGSGSKVEFIWALRDVSFEVRRGEVLGIIGRNGAGKSTALKILSKITHPTEGRVELRGRVGSLLEVGTGFHPELTGRENIFLNGAILGMPRGEIKAKFDEIVAFAETEKFLDTPVKHYSSGMYVRLAFSVAIHVDPDILLIDEVLAVGDSAFRNRCYDRLAEMRNRDTAIILISHNLEQIARVCSSAILLDHGRIQYLGDTQTALNRYIDIFAGQQTHAANTGTGEIEIVELALCDEKGAPLAEPRTGAPLQLRARYRSRVDVENPNIIFALRRNSEVILHEVSGWAVVNWPIRKGEGVITITYDFFPINQGIVDVTVAIWNETISRAYCWHERALRFTCKGNPKNVAPAVSQVKWKKD